MYKIYQVEYGESLNDIANKVGTTVSDLININGFDPNLTLNVGDLIIVPSKVESIFEKYIVSVGDTLYSISKMYNIDPSTLLLINGLNENDFIYPNQEILIPSDDYVIYITQSGDTLNKVTSNLGVDANTLSKDNGKIFLMEDQLIVKRKQ